MEIYSVQTLDSRQANISKTIFVTFFLVSSAGVYAISCPSPPVTYASEGDNVTLCWTLSSEATSQDLKTFSVMALKRPAELVMEKVALINNDGSFWRFFENLHDGLYTNRVTAEADLHAMTMILGLTNFTSKMENVYCVVYELFGAKDVHTCYSQALILRDIGEYIWYRMCVLCAHCARN